MRLISEDGKRVVNIGGSDIWKSLYSTAVSCLGENERIMSWHLDSLKRENVMGMTGIKSQDK